MFLIPEKPKQFFYKVAKNEKWKIKKLFSQKQFFCWDFDENSAAPKARRKKNGVLDYHFQENPENQGPNPKQLFFKITKREN